MASAPLLLGDAGPFDTNELAEALEQLDEYESHPEMKTLDAPPDLISSFEKVCEKAVPDTFDMKVRDGAAVVHLLFVNSMKTFNDYAANFFLHYMRHLRLQTGLTLFG